MGTTEPPLVLPLIMLASVATAVILSRAPARQPLGPEPVASGWGSAWGRSAGR